MVQYLFFFYAVTIEAMEQPLKLLYKVENKE